MAPTWRTRDHAAPSVFRPEHLLREARRQRGLPARDVPEICALDPDGDLVRHLRRTGQAGDHCLRVSILNPRGDDRRSRLVLTHWWFPVTAGFPGEKPGGAFRAGRRDLLAPRDLQTP